MNIQSKISINQHLITKIIINCNKMLTRLSKQYLIQSLMFPTVK